MQKYGVVESLIYYGQGGKNLDMLPARMQTEKARLADFDEFYKINSDTIQRMLIQGKSHDDDDIQREGSDEEERQEGDEQLLDDVTVHADAENESFISGEGLAECLSILGASKNAGNTSLDLVNEAQDILKLFLKKGKIDKVKYRQLESMF